MQRIESRLNDGLPVVRVEEGRYARPVTVRIPDTDGHDMQVPMPYYRVDCQKPDGLLDELAGLVSEAERSGLPVVYDCGCGEALTPLLTAASLPDGCLVIGLDPRHGPFAEYTEQFRAWNGDRRLDPRVVRTLQAADFRNSAAFYFPLDMTDPVFLERFAGTANRVQIVAPCVAEDGGALTVRMLASGTGLLAGGGTLILVGDYRNLNACAMEQWFRRKLHDRNTGRAVADLFGAYRRVEFAAPSWDDLAGMGLCDGGWLWMPEDKRLSQYAPGLAVFSGKKDHDGCDW